MFRKVGALLVSAAMLGLIPAYGAAAEPEPEPRAGCVGVPDIIGTPGDDVLIGTDGADNIDGLGGNDTIYGLGGRDLICGGNGADVIFGGDGDDSIDGGAGPDVIRGNKGDDLLWGGLGNDRLFGGPGRDVIKGHRGRDTMYGRSGNDTLWAGNGNDLIVGNGGRDEIRGGNGDDVARGKGDNDSILGGGGADVLWGGPGRDLLDGGPASDVLYGRDHIDVLLGDGGNDTLRAGEGADTLWGGAGLDLLDAGPGNDSCRDDGIPIECPAQPGNAYGGEVVVATAFEPGGLNGLVLGTSTNFLIHQAAHGGVFDIDATTLQPIPDIVNELPSLDNGGVTLNIDGTMSVTYMISDDAVWSDGVPISGDDFQFTLDLFRDPDLSLFHEFEDVYDDIIVTEATAKTFKFTLATPTLEYELMFDIVVPKHAVESTDFTNDWNDTLWPSAGPFVLGEWVKGSHLTLVRNDNYWKRDPDTGQQLPYLDEVTFEFTDAGWLRVRDAFIARKYDVYRPTILSIPDRLEPIEEAGAQATVRPTVWEHLNFQFGPGRLDRNPTSANENLNFRKGVAHAIDRQLLTSELLNGRLPPINSLYGESWPSVSTDPWSQYDYDPVKAAAYFDDAKVDLGVDDLNVVFTTSNTDQRVALAELLGPMFDAVGVAFDVQLESSGTFFGTTIVEGTFDLSEWAWSTVEARAGALGVLDIFDPEQNPVDDVANHYRWGSPDSSVIDEASARFAEIRDLAYATFDNDSLTPLLQEAEQILADHVIALPLYRRPEVLIHWDDEIGNVQANTSSSTYMWNVERWFRADR